ncbi:Phospholipase/lecithinase/hemolysin [Paracidovorax valerianellae]|uniref:Phospholipase/lecithinase/hemolysin n=1 Tax=Paracidovorax valerianellae TaxID=187868 RepID=A0A1G6SFU0_9BURK|nr:SGNH/GDSL hydrolase family protein [Paracidovorax valerianellae]SDD14975.1 Phospholipase/lecithinase/hemolysin [Paracidovorax valerianellae]
MAANWMRRTLVVAACATATLLAACGSSTTESAITPDRFITFGDGFSDMGQNGARYTVNDGSINNWTQQIANNYGKSFTPAAAGGTGYAQGNARVTATTDAAGRTTTPSVTQQIDTFLSKGGFAENDLVMINGGISDVIAGMAAVNAGTQTSAQFLTNAATAGKELAAQVRRLSNAGAKHVVVTGTYDLGKSPWAVSINQTTLLSNASTQFNQALLVNIEDLGTTVLYVDLAYYGNVFVGSPSGYGFTDKDNAVCTSVDPNNGIGIGTGRVNSLLCNASTLLPGAAQDKYVFADPVYFSPSAQRQFGTYAYDRLRARW